MSIIKTTEPFFFPGNRTGVLLIHGFTGTPKEMRWMGEYLHEQGCTCLGIRLAGHATTPNDMIRSRWTDWTASVEDGYHLLRGMTDRIFLVGLSMGGVLSLLMSTRLDVAGIVAMSTPYQLPRDEKDYSPEFIEFYSRFVKFMPKSNEVPGESWFDKEAFKSHISYPQNPIRPIAEMKRLIRQMREALPQVTQPVLLIHSKNDRYVLPENVERLYDGLVNASDKTKAYVVEAGHVVTRDAARHQVFELARDFIRRLENQS
ncbi:MAG TPA: alpha/beta fold hydrolase [Anaerolineales bacterium]|nr:alpha/beta fold hydrolase [Anaerolineales bacterium]HNA87768.1 alpha/beta fold hydrolase [Anaerolineales bacterium]HNB34928.1 alpha/beta fold hydrolase [Anaerolineales bacterium]HNC08062.1 alpha/beta fold hydrolase [Anaerolineales bacterium]